MKSSTEAADLPHSLPAASMLCAEDVSRIKMHGNSSVVMESAKSPPPHPPPYTHSDGSSSSATFRFEEEST